MDAEYAVIRIEHDRDTGADDFEPVPSLESIPESIVERLKGATPEQMQEAADAAYILQNRQELHVWFSKASECWWAQSEVASSQPGDTRAKALRALAEQVKEVTT